MLRLKYWIKDFFGFSRSQVNGTIILLILTTVVLFSEPCWRLWGGSRTDTDEADRALLDSLVAVWQGKASIEAKANDSVTRTLYRFDPNTATYESLLKLGFSDKVASRIIRYREKGGQFRIKTDLSKIYGIDSTFYREIYTFIALPERRAPTQKRETINVREAPAVSKKAAEKFDLNTADTAQLKDIYGVGDKLSMRIIKYREALGGFVSMSQLREVYGLDSLVIDRLENSSEIKANFKPRKMDINTATEKELGAHPYLGKLARAVVSYRFQHGAFKTVSDIRSIGSLDENTIQKITPYLKVGDEL
jgi:DNA uptake protein ComE-like DNA-binding protein